MFKKIIFTILSAILTSSVFAQTEATASQSGNLETLLYLVIGLVLLISVLVLLVAIYTLFVVRTILLQEQAKAEEEGVEIIPEVSIWTKISKSLTGAPPLKKRPIYYWITIMMASGNLTITFLHGGNGYFI